MGKRKRRDTGNDTTHAHDADQNRSPEPTTELTTMRQSATDDTDAAVVKLDIRGKRLRVLRSTLITGPSDSLLARMFALEETPWSCRPQPDGSYFIDDDPQDFDAVLCYLRYGTDGVRFDSAARAWRARALATYYMLDDMAQVCLVRALNADLYAAPQHAIGTISYGDRPMKRAADPEDMLGISHEPKDTYMTTPITFVRDWPASHLLALIAHNMGKAVDDLDFYKVDWINSGWALGQIPLIRLDETLRIVSSALPVSRFFCGSDKNAGLLVEERNSTDG